MSDIQIIPVSSASALKRFVQLPMRLNKTDPAWIAPLLMERLEALTPKTNPFFQHADVQLWLASRDGHDVGRISAQIDHLAPPDPAGAVGHFGMIAAEDDPEVFAALFRTAESWLKARGRDIARGPFNLSVNEETGLLVDGYETPPMVMMGHDPRYAATRVEEQGYAKVKDVFAYIVDLDTDFPPKVRERVNRPLPVGIRLRQLDFKNYDRDVRDMTEIVNEAWAGNWGFTPITEAETQQLAKSMKPILDPRMVWFAELEGRPVAFGVCLPNVNEAIADLNGRLLPFGWAKLLWRLKVKGVKTARVPLMGLKRAVARDFRAMLIPFLIIDAMAKGARKAGIRDVEMSWILEDNRPMRAIIEAVGSNRYKTYRIYEKRI